MPREQERSRGSFRTYRIRWSRVTVLGRRDTVERMCIAERERFLFGFVRIWWPVADWRRSDEAAEADIAADIALAARFPHPRMIYVD